MKILSVECTASPAGVCIYDGEKILASNYINVKLTHSQTLMPMLASALKSTMLNINDIDGISVAAGPGSFTGVRIGISLVKGLAAKNDLPCVGVSSLEAMAYQFLDCDAVISPVMDARCNQYYNALFCVKNGTVTRICQDRAISSDDLADEIKKIKNRIVICGDGADKFYNELSPQDNIVIADTFRKFQSAIGVALSSYNRFASGDTVAPDMLSPIYLRLPQAERELLQKQKKDV